MTLVEGQGLRRCDWTTSIEATAAVVGLAVATVWVSAFIGGSGTTAASAATLLMSVLVGLGAARILEVLCDRQWIPALAAMATLPAIVWGLENVLLSRVNPLILVAFAAGIASWRIAGQASPVRRSMGVLGLCGAVVTCSVTPVGAWTVGEPGSTNPAV